VAIPEEVRAAKRINAEGERILEKAHDESTRIVSRAQEQAAFLIGERGLTETAHAEGRRIVEQAEDVGAGIRSGADDYAANILGTLEVEAVNALAGIRKGIEVLEARRAELQAQAPEDEHEPMLADVEIPVTEDEDAGSRSPSLR
jgi:cell division septum initiation protein DivIVA